MTRFPTAGHLVSWVKYPPGVSKSAGKRKGNRSTDADLAELDRWHRAHARVEQRIRDAKATGLGNLPSADFAINQIWLQLVLCAQDLLAWFAVLTLDGDLAVATPATVRYRLLHVAGRITSSSRRVTLAPGCSLAVGHRPGRSVPKTPRPAPARVTEMHR